MIRSILTKRTRQRNGHCVIAATYRQARTFRSTAAMQKLRRPEKDVDSFANDPDNQAFFAPSPVPFLKKPPPPPVPTVTTDDDSSLLNTVGASKVKDAAAAEDAAAHAIIGADAEDPPMIATSDQRKISVTISSTEEGIPLVQTNPCSHQILPDEQGKGAGVVPSKNEQHEAQQPLSAQPAAAFPFASLKPLLGNLTPDLHPANKKTSSELIAPEQQEQPHSAADEPAAAQTSIVNADSPKVYNELRMQQFTQLKAMAETRGIELPFHINEVRSWRIALTLHRLDYGKSTECILTPVHLVAQQEIERIRRRHEVTKMKKQVFTRAQASWRRQQIYLRWGDVFRRALIQALRQRGVVVSSDKRVNRVRLCESVLGLPISLDPTGDDEVFDITETPEVRDLEEEEDALDKALRKIAREQEETERIETQRLAHASKLAEYNEKLSKLLQERGVELPEGDAGACVAYKLALYLHRLDRGEDCSGILVPAFPPRRVIKDILIASRRNISPNAVKKQKYKMAYATKMELMEKVVAALKQRGESLLDGELHAQLQIRLAESVLRIPPQDRFIAVETDEEEDGFSMRHQDIHYAKMPYEEDPREEEKIAASLW